METIDITPTWEGVLPLLLAALESNSVKAIEAAETELKRMAKLADLYVAAQKESAQ